MLVTSMYILTTVFFAGFDNHYSLIISYVCLLQIIYACEFPLNIYVCVCLFDYSNFPYPFYLFQRILLEQSKSLSSLSCIEFFFYILMFGVLIRLLFFKVICLRACFLKFKLFRFTLSSSFQRLRYICYH